MILSQLYRPFWFFLSLLALDIASHWLQMYSTFLSGKASHKDVKESTNWLFKAYYGNRIFMAYCCVACEVLYIILFLLAEHQTENVLDVLVNAPKHGGILQVPVYLALFGWGIKQAINVIQVLTISIFRISPRFFCTFFTRKSYSCKQMKEPKLFYYRT